jgi:hypothetical protein
LESARHLLTLTRFTFGICIKQLTLSGGGKVGYSPLIGISRRYCQKAPALSLLAGRQIQSSDDEVSALGWRHVPDPTEPALDTVFRSVDHAAG